MLLIAINTCCYSEWLYDVSKHFMWIKMRQKKYRRQIVNLFLIIPWAELFSRFSLMNWSVDFFFLNFLSLLEQQVIWYLNRYHINKSIQRFKTYIAKYARLLLIILRPYSTNCFLNKKNYNLWFDYVLYRSCITYDLTTFFSDLV